MATARPTLAAEHRDVTGKKVARLRHAGRLPAVVYGHGVDSENVTVDTHEFEQLRQHVGPNALVDLSVDGKKAHPVLIIGVQIHPVNRRPLHVDLFLVRMTEELTVDVPLVAVGESAAVTQLNGTLLHPTESVRVKALPDHLPQSDRVLDRVAGRLRRRDPRARPIDPDDVTLLTDGDEIIAKVQAPRIEVEEEPVVEEGEEGVEGEAERGAGGGAGGRLRPVASRHQTKARRKKATPTRIRQVGGRAHSGPSAGRPLHQIQARRRIGPPEARIGRFRASDASPASGTG